MFICNLFILILFYDIVVNKMSPRLFLIIINNNAISSRITKNCAFVISSLLI